MTHRIGEAHACSSVGWFHALRGDYAEALTHCARALELCEELDYMAVRGFAWHTLGFVRHQTGQLTEAITCYARALEVWRHLANRYEESQTLCDIGDAHRAMGDLQAARQAWHDALAILDDLGHPDTDRLRVKISGAAG